MLSRGNRSLTEEARHFLRSQSTSKHDTIMNAERVVQRVKQAAVAFFVSISLLNSVGAATLNGNVSGTLSRTNSPYLVTADVFINSGQTLTVEPGVMIQFQNPSDALVVDGTLIARGTAAAPMSASRSRMSRTGSCTRSKWCTQAGVRGRAPTCSSGA